tara:strand:- start:652 stop:2157 length:1506 start_codon:yes stop_codon:yes gene_type:complete
MYRTLVITKSPEKIRENQEDFEDAENIFVNVAVLLSLISSSTAASQDVKDLVTQFVEDRQNGISCVELNKEAEILDEIVRTDADRKLWEEIKSKAPVSCFDGVGGDSADVTGVNYIDYSPVNTVAYPTDQTDGGVYDPNDVITDNNSFYYNWSATRITRSIEKKELESVKTMLGSDFKININEKDNYGKTAFDYMLEQLSEPIDTKICYEMLQHNDIFSVDQLVKILDRFSINYARWEDWRILDSIMDTKRVPEDKINSIMDENKVKGFVNSIDDTNMILKPLLEKLIDVNPRNKNVMYRESIKNHRKGIFEKLMKIEPYEPNKETGDTLLHLATGAMNNSDNANAIVKDLLINQPNTIYEENTRGLTPLMVAVINSNSDAINLFKNHYSQTVIDVMNLEVKRTELYRRTLRLYKYINSGHRPATKKRKKRTIRDLVVKLEKNKEQQKRIREQWESSSEQLPTEQLTREQSVMTTDFGYIGVPRDVRKELDGLGNLGLKRR